MSLKCLEIGLAAVETATGQPFSEARFARLCRGGFSGRHLGEFFGDVRGKCGGGRDVAIAGGRVTLTALGNAAAIERARKPWVEIERSIVVGDGGSELTKLQIGESPAIERVG